MEYRLLIRLTRWPPALDVSLETSRFICRILAQKLISIGRQSLLLDPDARIGIDLHKRLFLLVTGRGE